MNGAAGDTRGGTARAHALWPTAWVRAALEPAILGALLPGPLHGYAIAQALAGRGFGRLRGGSLYPVLARLEEAELVSATWSTDEPGPGRKDYQLTAAGHQEYRDAVARWRSLGAALDDFAADAPHVPAAPPHAPAAPDDAPHDDAAPQTSPATSPAPSRTRSLKGRRA
ncbi:MAG: PadR family transcriptional regulator [Micrococcus sp.]|nr:PadR family transcriptional regulator [Micrococcus sp.]